MLTYLEAVQLLQSNSTAWNSDFSKILAKSMSCKFNDDELLNFWDILLESIRLEQKKYEAKDQSINMDGLNSWLCTLVGMLAKETVEFLSDIPKPLVQDVLPEFEVGSLVRPIKKFKHNRYKGDSWGQIRGIWLQGFYSRCQEIIDIETENQWGFNLDKLDDKQRKMLARAHNRLVQGMSFYNENHETWFRTHEPKLSDSFMANHQGEEEKKLSDYVDWIETQIPEANRKDPVGIVMGKKYVDRSADLLMSDMWFYQISWVDWNGLVVTAWHPELLNNLEAVNGI